MFADNFRAYADGVSDGVRAAGPVVLEDDGTHLKVAGPGEG